MPDVAKLKKKAAEFELKKQFDKALAVYVEILDGFDASDEEVDVSLFNRVGDLYLKQGSVGDAVDYYEKAVDRYADGGFHNNAIALCNKILRNSPGRASVYYKLGKISAQKGFKGDAKKNFLEYADRMQSSGKIDEAFRALKEFADLCPDQDDIRLMLADQLSKKGRNAEAIEQLQLLYVRYSHEGRDAEARATVERMRSIDPSAEPRELGDAPSRSAAGLVFLDLNDSAPKARRASNERERAMLGLEIIATGEVPEIPAEPVFAPPVPTPSIAQTPAPTEAILETSLLDPAVLDGVTRAGEFERSTDVDMGGGLLDGLETTSFAPPPPPAADAHDLLDFEPTSFGSPAAPAPVEPPPPAATLPSAGDLLDFDMPHATPISSPRQSEPVRSISLTPAHDFGTIEFNEPQAEPEFEPELEPEPELAPELDPEEDSGHHGRGSLLGLPLLADEQGEAPSAAPEEDIGGDLQFIMPDGTPARGSEVQADPLDDLPLMDLDLPVPGEAQASITGEPAGTSLEFEITEPDEQEDEFVLDDVEEDDEPALPAARRQSTVIAEQDVDLLLALSEADPDDNLLRRRLAEAMLESGDREGGLRELETAMVGFERAEDLMAASKVADEIVLLNPGSVRHHQKRVEYAFRTNERGRLIDAYLQLAEALFSAGQADKSRAIYQRVLDLAPDDIRAQAALETFPEPEPEPVAPPPPKTRQSTVMPRVSSSVPAPVTPLPLPVTSDDEYINLGDWLRDDEAPKDTRMIVDEEEPTGDEEADFQDMLRKFKQGVSENVEEEDHQSHYDLGVAYKEMGLLDEAIAEFQKALRAPANRVPTYEALGLCFIEKEQYPMAATILSRALHEPGMSESQLIGVLYLLGRCAEERGQNSAAIEYYQRVFVVDIQFQDVGERLAAVEGASS
jgi:tetratricopeptide (TPR) repeat protein